MYSFVSYKHFMFKSLGGTDQHIMKMWDEWHACVCAHMDDVHVSSA